MWRIKPSHWIFRIATFGGSSVEPVFIGLLFSQSAFAQVVSWGNAQNIHLGGVSTILMILTMLGLGTFVFPKLKGTTLRSFFMMFMVGGMLSVASSGGMLSSVNAANAQVIITTASGSQHISGGTTEIINNYSQAVQIRIDPQECTVSTGPGGGTAGRVPLVANAVTATTACATSQSLPAGQGCSVSLSCPATCTTGLEPACNT